MSIDRRRQRSVRIVVASVLLAAASLVVTTAVALASQSMLIVASVTTLLAGIAAARIISNELAQTRREWARDRAEQAQAYQAVLAEQAKENAEFASVMTAKVERRDKIIVELNGTVRLVEARAAQAEKKVDELKVTVDALRADLEVPSEEEAMALWDGADVPTIVDLLNWEAGVVTRPHEDEVDDRKQA